MGVVTADLMQDLLPRIFGYVPPLDFFRAAASSSKTLGLQWYLGQFPSVIVVPDDVASINEAINRLASRGGGHASPRSSASSKGLVLVRPGTYMESVRVTQNCCILGLGRCKDVIVEAPGWESALVFSGLGVRGFGSGEDACVANMTFRCRNEQMRGRCVYIVLGQPRLDNCSIQGGVLISGSGTAPQISGSHIRASWGSGLHLTDHCRGSLTECVVAGNRRHGILVDRASHPRIAGNIVKRNAACGIRVFCGALGPLPEVAGMAAARSLDERIRGNELTGNGAGDSLCLTPRFADTEEMQLDFDFDEVDDADCHKPGAETPDGDFHVFAPVGAEDINWGPSR